MRKSPPKALVAECAAAAAEGKLAVFIDFDRTLTHCFTSEGVRGTSAHGVLESASLLSDQFQKQTKALFEKYYPIEIHATMTVQEKTPLMTEWYTSVHNLMLKERITRGNLADAVAGCKSIQLREGIEEFLRHCQESQPPIPVLVMSAGLGDVIEEILRQHLPFRLGPATKVVSNRLTFDGDGRLCGFSEPLLHMFNKNVGFLGTDAKRLVEGCTACLLLGDGVGDATMADGLNHRTALKLGFLNEKVEARFAEFDKAFDAIVADDGPVPDVIFEALGARKTPKVQLLGCTIAVAVAAICVGVLARRRLMTT